jgi:hypothetical protein
VGLEELDEFGDSGTYHVELLEIGSVTVEEGFEIVIRLLGRILKFLSLRLLRILRDLS